MNILNSIFDFLLNWEIFGITPFRGLYTMLNSPMMWAILLGFTIIVFILLKLFGESVFLFIGMILNTIIKIVKFVVKNIALRIIDIYAFVRIKNDSKDKGYLWSEFWANRVITVKGIVARDVTGAQNLVIEHPVLIGKTINIIIVIKRMASNVFLFIKSIFVRA